MARKKSYYNKNKTTRPYYNKNKTTNELTNMFINSTNNDLYDSITQSKYYKDFSNGQLLKDIEKNEEKLISAYQNTQTMAYTIGQFFESSEILQGLMDAKETVKDTTEFLTKLTPGKIDNLLIKFFNTADDILVNNFIEGFENDYNFYKDNLDKAKDTMYDLMVRGIDDLQHLGELVRQDTFYYHFGFVNNNKELEIFQINSDLMHQFEQDKNLFEVSIQENISKKTKYGTGNYTIRFQSQNDKKDDIIDSLTNLLKKDKDNESNLMLQLTQEQQNYWKDIAGSNLYSRITNNNENPSTLGYGRKFEIFSQDIFGDQSGPTAFETARQIGMRLDNATWLTQGDITNQTTKTSYQDKFITDGRFGISSLSTIKTGLEFYVNAIKDYDNKDSPFWNQVNEMRFENDPLLQTVDSEGTTVFEQQLEEQWQEEAVEESEEFLDDFFAT